MRLLAGALVLLVALPGCSEPPRGQAPAERPKGGGIAAGMSEEVWKVYGGTESGVTEDAGGPAPPKEKQ